MTEGWESLSMLYVRFDAIAKRLAPGNSSAAHEAVVNRLEANRKLAAACGWTACELERQGGSGRLRLLGTPPAGAGREVVPDWASALVREPLPDAEREAELDHVLTRPAQPLRRSVGDTRVLGVDVAWAAEARWLNEGGR